MAQAHRIKTESPAIRVGILHFVHGVLREIGFWLLAAIALGMLIALVTFSPDDPAWTHTANVAQLHNLGGVVGAWFADVNLYFFGYPAYLLPLGVVFGGWRLFRRGALLKLDGEIVLLRVLGFVVTLTTACGLAALHLRLWPETLPSAGESAGGLVGVHVSQFLIHAFEFAGGNLFMLALLLAGITLTTGLSWLIALDWIGQAALKGFDWIGALIMAPLRRISPQPLPDDLSHTVEPTVEAVPVPHTETAPVAINPTRGWFQQAVAWPQAWWRMWWTDAAASARTTTQAATEATDQVPLSSIQLPITAATNAVAQAAEAPAGGHSTHTDPRSNPSPGRELPHSEPLATHPVISAPLNWESSSDFEMLTLVPTVAPARTVATPVAPAPVPLHIDQDNVQPLAASPTPATVATIVRHIAPPTSTAPYPLPPLNLLDSPPTSVTNTAAMLEPMSRRVEILLKHFGIAAKVAAVEPGPVITRFEISLTPGVSADQISHQSHDLARGLSVISVRVVEAIPGTSMIGVEIPNSHREIIALRELLAAPIYTQSISPLMLVLGKDIGGTPVVANLAKMPHLLMAGSPDSGQTLVINAMLLSLLYKAPPNEVRLILVAPKMPELSLYQGIPHLLTPVITETRKAANALRWCISEMERRYQLITTFQVRNIAGLNRKISDGRAAGQDTTDPLWTINDNNGIVGTAPLLSPLPLIVVVIDDLAEIMMVIGKEVEDLIARLTQKAHTVGIHLILATQQQSGEVITGLIKANIPARIAFQASSPAASRIILDQIGAEQLLDQGDMLYLPTRAGLPQRVHSALVKDYEVARVVNYLRQAGTPDYREEVLA